MFEFDLEPKPKLVDAERGLTPVDSDLLAYGSGLINRMGVIYYNSRIALISYSSINPSSAKLK